MFHSIILQGTCDARKRFTNVYTGSPVSTHDARVLSNCAIFHLAEIKHLIDVQHHILGDSAYPLKTCLLVPYLDSGKLTHTERRYNKRLSQTRITIEHAFGLLKSRFRRLLFTLCAEPQYATNIVHAACILHNICQEDMCTDESDEDTDNDSNVVTAGNGDDGDGPAKLKRQRIAELFML